MQGLVVLFAMIALTASACSPVAQTESQVPSAPAAAPPMIVAPPPVIPDSPPARDSIRVALSVDSASRPGAPIIFRVSITNLLDRTVSLSIAGVDAPTWDVQVSHPDGTLVWNRLHGAVVGYVGGTLVLAPREAREDTVLWRRHDNDGRSVRAGSYVARGRLFSGMPQGTWTSAVPFTLAR